MEPDPSDSLIQLSPRNPTSYISRGRTALATGEDGFISGEDHGAWCLQTRMLSLYRWLINGKTPVISGNSAIEQHRWMGYYIAAPRNCKKTETHDCNPAQQTVELKLTRTVGNGFCETVELTNYTQISTKVRLELETDADFADPSEAKSGKRKQKGTLKRSWSKTGGNSWTLEYNYTAIHAFRHQSNKGVARMHRAIRLRVESSGTPRRAGQKIRFVVQLKPHETWRARINCEIAIGGEWLPLFNAPNSVLQRTENWDRERLRFIADSTSFSSGAAVDLTQTVLKTLARAKQDLYALRLYDLDRPGKGWVAAAGIPSYLAFFGRDAIAASWQSAPLSVELTRGVLAELSAHQATGTDNWRDEQPGRMVHEMHTNPLAVLNFTPHARYFGDITASIHFPVLVATLWHWTGNKEAVHRFIEPAMKALRWADENANVNGDGFYRYKTRSEQGEKNQGWKDSDDAIVTAEGRQVPDPLGTCEMQGFVYASKLQMAELLWWFGEADTAKRLHREAEELKKRFNDKFWMQRERFFGMAINARGRLVRSIASDPGRCLASGIIDESLVRPTAQRLLQPDLFSGWGIRCLSADHPAFNPYAYHRGTVWPVENATFILAMARNGLHAEADLLARALFEAAALFQHCRLPEVFAGHPRNEQHPFPGMYPRANSPQAWSASAPFMAIQALLGLCPYAPLKALFVDPWLPEWLPSLRVTNLHVGNSVVDLSFTRGTDGRADFHTDKLDGDLRVLRQPSPWSLTTGYGEQVRDTIASLASR